MKKKKPNILFIVLDTHRVDRLGCYGYHRNTTPNLDEFVKNSTLFKKAISPAQWTIPSHASMFTGEYPTTHSTIQASDALSNQLVTIAEYAFQLGYKTVGFCNNPLVGVLDNGFRRGFQEFYNYGGTVPSPPKSTGDNNKTFLSKIQDKFSSLIDRIATPIQQAVAISPEVLQIALNPILVPLWTRFSNFKGNTSMSIKDTTYYLNSSGSQPLFIFLNLMETHLPYTPPKNFIQKFGSIVLDDPEAGNFLRQYNTQALKWLLPLENPHPATQAKTINDMYDAEVAYQDFLLNQLLSLLDQPEHRENTLVIIVGDHGEMLGEHQIMGHGLGVFNDLIHVPLIIRFPEQAKPKHIHHSVSTIRVFNTILDTIGVEKISSPTGEIISMSNTSLKNTQYQPKYIFSEAYPPDSLLVIMKKYASELTERFNCHSIQRAVFNQPYKLIRIENVRDDVFNYEEDPKEMNPLVSTGTASKQLQAELEMFVDSAVQKGLSYTHNSSTNLGNQKVMERLRHLGYIE